MFRFATQQRMLRRSAQEGFKSRNIITRIYEIAISVLNYPDIKGSLEDTGLRFTQTGVSYHVNILPAILLIPHQSFEKYLGMEGCHVFPIKSHQGDEVVRADDLDQKSWKMFDYPKTIDGEKLANIAARILAEIERQIAESIQIEQMQRTAKTQVIQNKSRLWGILVEPGYRQPLSFEYSNERRDILESPSQGLCSNWKYDKKYDRDINCE